MFKKIGLLPLILSGVSALAIFVHDCLVDRAVANMVEEEVSRQLNNDEESEDED